MKYIVNVRTLWAVFLLPICALAAVEHEVLVLFQSDVLLLPAGKNSATPTEVTAPQEIIDCLYEIEVETIIKAVPSFDRADTMSVTEYGTIARLPDFSQLFVMMLREGTDRDSALAKLRRLDQVIHVEKNQQIALLTTRPNDTLFYSQWNLNDSTGVIGINVMKAWCYVSA